MANPVDIKRKVFDLAKTALPEFTPTWGFTTREPPRKWLYMGDLTWQGSEWATNRSREHNMTIPLILNAILARRSPEDCEAYLHDQLTALEAAFNADSTLRAAGVLSWALNPRQLGTQPHPDGVEAQAVFELRVTYRP